MAIAARTWSRDMGLPSEPIIGKTGYLKGADGQLQVSRRKDKSIVSS